MANEVIDAGTLKRMAEAAAGYLEQQKANVDALNVFPVPDGDTGTNMSQTVRSAYEEVSRVQSDSLEEVAKALSKGALKGARGNSGVILSQIFRGFAQVIGSVEAADGAVLAQAFASGVKMAYKAVMKPKEGTILTVARVSAEEVEKYVKKVKTASPMMVMKRLIAKAEETLKKTPDMLPVLKEAGVVDAGGVGLIWIFKGFQVAIEGKPLPEMIPLPQTATAALPNTVAAQQPETADIKFGYCTEFFIKNIQEGVSDKDVEKFKKYLKKIGDSQVVVGDLSMLKVHVHSNEPGNILQEALKLGELSGIKIDNMREQHREIFEDLVPAPTPAEPMKEMGMVAVVSGEGLSEIFRGLMVDGIVSGGQSMNPSTADIAAAVEGVNAKNVFVFPDNKNIVLAAEQAQEVVENKRIIVIPTKSIPQGIAAILAYHPELSVEENTERMMQAYDKVKTGQITRAVRDTSLNGTKIHDGDVLGLLDGAIQHVGQDVQDISMSLLRSMVNNEDEEFITVYAGEGVTPEQKDRLARSIEEAFPDCDLEIHDGGQPLYEYIFSVE